MSDNPLFEGDIAADSIWLKGPPININRQHDLDKLPLLKLALENLRRKLASNVAYIVDDHGMIPIKLRRARHSKFKDSIFSFDYAMDDSKQSAQLEDVENGLYDAQPFFSKTHPTHSLNVEELEAFTGPQQDYYWFDDQIEQLTNYYFQLAVMENSDVVAYLESIDAQWSYERRWDRLLLVIPDSKLALYLKLTYG